MVFQIVCLLDGEPINEQPRSIKDPVLNRIQPNPAPDDTQCADCCVCCISFCGQVCSSLWHWLWVLWFSLKHYHQHQKLVLDKWPMITQHFFFLQIMLWPLSIMFGSKLLGALLSCRLLSLLYELLRWILDIIIH